MTAVFLGVVATVGVIGSPYLLFGYHSPSLHLVFDSVDACIALLVSFLLWGRFRRRCRLQDVLLAQGLALLALASLGAGVVTVMLPDAPPLTLDVWFPQSLRLLGSLMVGAAALSGDRTVERRTGSLASLGVLAWIGIAFVVLWAARAQLPQALTAPPESAAQPVITGHPALLVAHTVGALCFLVAAAAFTAQATRRADELLRWVGPACVLAAFSRIHYMLFPSIYSGWIYTGDLFRTGCYLLLLVGAGREIGRYWSDQARLAVLDDRKRLARELHDGVVQELGYIRAEAQGLAGDDGVRQRIVDSADRGLDEARAAVDTLGRGAEEPLGLMLHRAARQVAERYGGHVVVDLDISVDVTHEQRHALVRITREAVSNAIRHGRADNIGIGLVRDDGACRLVVHDDGCGFDPAELDGGTGYGLTSMRERARNLPGSFEVSSAAGRGTTVAVTWGDGW
ncbi:MAG: sensor histidine kinase [Nocardioides sp.]